MSSEGSGERLSKKGTRTSPLPGTTSPEKSGEQETTQSRPKSPPPQQKKEGSPPRGELTRSQTTAKKPAPQSAPTPPATTTTTTTERDAPALVASSEGQEDDPPRQVIAVSASKGPAAFFNLARKFLATDEMCDLSALEGAIVSAVDAAHLLERSQLATIVR